MALEDWIIIAVLVACIIGGLAQGFFRSACSLAGLLIGLAVAAWNYGRLAALLLQFIRVEAAADAIAFIVIALLVMAVFGIAGNVLHKVFHKLGLGCLDRLGGGVFGFLQGIVFVTLGILVTIAFFPQARWLLDARLPHMFFGACHVSTRVTPSELGEKIHGGLRMLEQQSPWWMHPGAVKQ
jgi:membrane protein required for colicin V production